MIINNIQGSRDYPASPLKINKQKSFKAYENIKSPTGESKGMTDEQKTWLGVGLTAVASIVIGLVVWACSKKTKTSEVIKTIDKSKLNPEEQVKDLEKNMQKHFVKITLKEFKPKWEMVKVVPNVLAPFEAKNDFQLYEMKTLVPQLLGRKQQLLKNGNIESKSNEKETFIEYLKLRSEYFDKDNEFDVIRSEVLKNPNDDVVDAETLRLYMLVNNTRQFLYSDKSVEEKHNMENFVRPLLYANFSAKMLEEFKPQKPQKDMTENEKKYFEYMNKLGAFWHDRLKKEANEKLPNFVKIITGEVKAPKCYGQQEHDPRRIPQFYYFKSLYEILSGKAKAKWKVMEKTETINYKGRNITLPSLKDNIIKLENSFIGLKQVVDKKNSNLKNYIENLIPKVLV